MRNEQVEVPSQWGTDRLFFGGSWHETQARQPSFNPARTNEEIGRIAVASPADIGAAVEAARAAQPLWDQSGALNRGAYLRRIGALLVEHADRLARVLAAEEGKTLREATAEVLRGADNFAYHGADLWAAEGELYASPVPTEEIHVIRNAVGVVGVITPWNFPVAIPARKIAPALACGNTVVWKPSSLTGVTGVAMARILEEAGLPAGVFNVVTGGGEVGRTLASSPIDALTFTGSTAVGHELERALVPRGVHVQLELGGHNPAVVLPDANLDVAAHHIVDGAMISTGQRCTATRRVIAHRSVYDELLMRVIAETQALRLGDPLDEATDVGPIVSPAARDAVIAAIKLAKTEGWTIACGGSIPSSEDLKQGAFLEPTVLVDGPADSTFAKEEVFGPVTAFFSVDDEDEALRLANATSYGLSASVFTASQRSAQKFTREIDAGVVHINGPTVGAEPHVPFGGWRNSGGQAPPEMGHTARDFFTHVKTVYVRPDSG